MKYLITGAHGQLGKEFVKNFSLKGYTYFAFSHSELDICDFKKVVSVIKEIKPDVVINCAAYNFVDLAEENFDEALRVNTIGVANLAYLCYEKNILLVHYSTDYVFDGEKKDLYKEEDQPKPLNKYALSKYLGERVVQSLNGEYFLFRVSWVYGEGRQNFLFKLDEWAKSQEYLRIACDEFSVPTSTRVIVEVTLKAVETGLRGLYHLVCSGYASRYEWAKLYFRLKGINKFIYPVSQSEFNLPAKRPKFSAMSNEKISRALQISIPSWEEELAYFVKREKLKK